MSDAQLMHASRMAEGKEAYQGKLIRSTSIRLEGRGSFDNFKFAHVILAWAVVSDDPTAMDKVKLFFDMFSAAPDMVHKFMDPCRGEYLWYKGYTDF